MADGALSDVKSKVSEVESEQGSFASPKGEDIPDFTGDHDYKGVAGKEVPGGGK
jgi:hypothetical protein